MATKQQKQDKLELNVTKREIFGKKLNALRRQHILPANVYGENIESQALQIQLKDFITVYKKAHETHIIYLLIDSKELPVIISHVQKHPVTDDLLHVDFRNVNLKKKLETAVPIKIIGESDAVKQNVGVLLTLSESLLVEALPEDIPSEIIIDISALQEINNELKVKDVPLSGNYVVKEDPEKLIIRIAEHKEEDITPQIVAPETVEITTEKKVEGEEGAEAEATPAEEKKEKEQKAEK